MATSATQVRANNADIIGATPGLATLILAGSAITAAITGH
jgi:hypothetical protein